MYYSLSGLFLKTPKGHHQITNTLLNNEIVKPLTFNINQALRAAC